MSNLGFPQTGLSAPKFYNEILKEADANKRRRLFADARQSNLCSHQVYVIAAEAEEIWGADPVRLKAMLTKGVVVFKNPAGQGASCSRVSRSTWLREAFRSESRGHTKTATALREAIKENL
ncbi:hypothetical protein BGZ46_005997 [Entomortierella lignicola]|nr:hypothetical protein BGZ46_005997 [Entomortierella lignicola]